MLCPLIVLFSIPVKEIDDFQILHDYVWLHELNVQPVRICMDFPVLIQQSKDQLQIKDDVYVLGPWFQKLFITLFIYYIIYMDFEISYPPGGCVLWIHTKKQQWSTRCRNVTSSWYVTPNTMLFFPSQIYSRNWCSVFLQKAQHLLT